eukprot:359472-Chlamydomonas_euryale.AAC.6
MHARIQVHPPPSDPPSGCADVEGKAGWSGTSSSRRMRRWWWRVRRDQPARSSCRAAGETPGLEIQVQHGRQDACGIITVLSHIQSTPKLMLQKCTHYALRIAHSRITHYTKQVNDHAAHALDTSGWCGP